MILCVSLGLRVKKDLKKTAVNSKVDKLYLKSKQPEW